MASRAFFYIDAQPAGEDAHHVVGTERAGAARARCDGGCAAGFELGSPIVRHRARHGRERAWHETVRAAAARIRPTAWRLTQLRDRGGEKRPRSGQLRQPTSELARVVV